MKPTPATDPNSSSQPAATNVTPMAPAAAPPTAPSGEHTSPFNRALQAACTALTATRDKGEGYVRAQPLKSIVIVASLAALIGMLFSRR